jgi:hypothetical protein
VCDVVLLSGVHVLDPDLELLAEVLDVDVHVLVHPFRVLSTITADFRAPFLEHTSLHNNEGVHLVKHATSVVFDVSFNNVDLEVTMSPAAADNFDTGLHHRLLHLLLLLVLLLLHGLLHNCNVWLLHHGLLNNNNMRLSHADRAGVDELRAEVDATSVRASFVHERNPFLHASRAGKHLDGNFGVGDQFLFVMANALNLKCLTDVLDIDVKKLSNPLRVFSTVMALLRAPILEDTSMEVNVGAHLVKGAAYLVFENGFNGVKSEESSVRDHWC